MGEPYLPNSVLGGDAWGTNIKELQRPDMNWDKVDPESVHYRKAVSGERCDNCQMSAFPPGTTQGVCTLVKPPAAQKGFICDEWEPIVFVHAKQEAVMDLDSVRLEVAELSLDSLLWIEYSRQFTDERRQQLAKEGKAESDGSFPIENVGDLKNAIRAIGRSKNPSKTKAHIRSRAKALGATNLIPADWDQDGDS